MSLPVFDTVSPKSRRQRKKGRHPLGARPGSGSAGSSRRFLIRIHPSSAAQNHLAQSVQIERSVQLELPAATLEGMICLPPNARGLVVFAHAETGGQRKPRNRRLARRLAAKNIGVLQVELPTGREQAEDNSTERFQNRSAYMAERLLASAQWVRQWPRLEQLPLGFLGFGPGGTVALMAAAALAAAIDAVAVIDGEPDLVGDRLAHVLAATLLIVSDGNHLRLRRNQIGFARLRSKKKFGIVPGDTGCSDDGALDRIAGLTATWLQKHLQTRWTPMSNHAN